MGEIRSYKFESYAWIDAESEEAARTQLEARVAFPTLYGRTEWELTEMVAPEDAPEER